MKKGLIILMKTHRYINSNIEIINSNLWVVDFNYVINGWINEITFLETTNEEIATFAVDKNSNKQIIILNKNYHGCQKIKNILIEVTKLSTSKMMKEKYINKHIRKTLNDIQRKNESLVELEKKLYLLACKLEIERRKDC